MLNQWRFASLSVDELTTAIMSFEATKEDGFNEAARRFALNGDDLIARVSFSTGGFIL